MKTKSAKKYSSFQKAMIIIVPLILMLLIASFVTLFAMYFTHNFGGFGFFSPGNIVIILATSSALLAVVGIIFAFVAAGKESDDDSEESE